MKLSHVLWFTGTTCVLIASTMRFGWRGPVYVSAGFFSAAVLDFIRKKK